MVRVVDCHTGVLGSNTGGPKDFSLWNYFSSWKMSGILPRIPERVCGNIDRTMLMFPKILMWTLSPGDVLLTESHGNYR